MNETLQVLRQFMDQVFQDSKDLVYLPVAALIFVLFLIVLRKQNQNLFGPWTKPFGQPVHYPKQTRKVLTWPHLVQFCAIFLAILALARPQWGEEQDVQKSTSLDLVLAVDVSASMLAEDISPNRLERSKAAVSKLLENLGPDRVALMVFAGSAHTILPFTPDHGAVNLFLSGIDESLITSQGTNLEDVVREVLSLFQARAATEGEERVLILFSDGEDTAQGIQHLDRLPESGIRVFTVGAGTEKGVPIPVRDDYGKLSGYKKDRSGQVVTTKLQQSLLEEMARKGNGMSVVLTRTGEELTALSEALKTLQRGEANGATRIKRRDQFIFFLSIACLMWALPYAVSVFRNAFSFRKAGTAGFVFVLLAAKSQAGQTDLRAWKRTKEGLSQFSEKQFEASAEDFASAQNATNDPRSKQILEYNLGRSLSEKGDKEGAQKAFLRSLEGPEAELTARSRFALGDLKASREDWDGALQDYSSAMESLSKLQSPPPWSKDLSHNAQLALQRKLNPQQNNQENKQDQNQDQDKSRDKSEDKSSQDPSPKDQKQDHQDQEKPEDNSQKSDSEDDSQAERENEQKSQEKQPAQKSKSDPKRFESETLTPEDARQLLNALMENEKEALKAHIKQEQKEKGSPSKSGDKDW